MSKKFTEYSQLNLSDINKEVLKKWDENDVFSRSMTEREGHPSFVFYEGPPSANGMPGIHHVMARTIKDTFCRFKTMKGFQVGIHTDCRWNWVWKKLWALPRKISVRPFLWQNITNTVVLM
jgi:isoleucyl-tRNA synthetase